MHPAIGKSPLRELVKLVKTCFPLLDPGHHATGIGRFSCAWRLNIASILAHYR